MSVSVCVCACVCACVAVSEGPKSSYTVPLMGLMSLWGQKASLLENSDIFRIAEALKTTLQAKTLAHLNRGKFRNRPLEMTGSIINVKT